MEVVILNENGDNAGNLEIVDEIFKSEVNNNLLYEAIKTSLQIKGRELILLKREEKFQEAVKTLETERNGKSESGFYKVANMGWRRKSAYSKT